MVEWIVDLKSEIVERGGRWIVKRFSTAQRAGVEVSIKAEEG